MEPPPGKTCLTKLRSQISLRPDASTVNGFSEALFCRQEGLPVTYLTPQSRVRWHQQVHTKPALGTPARSPRWSLSLALRFGEFDSQPIPGSRKMVYTMGLHDRLQAVFTAEPRSASAGGGRTKLCRNVTQPRKGVVCQHPTWRQTLQWKRGQAQPKGHVVHSTIYMKCAA